MDVKANRLFSEAYRKFDAGDHAEALRALSDLSEQLDDPWERAALLYHEALFRLGMNEAGLARQILEKFKKMLAFLGLPADGYEDDLPHNLAVMVGYTEVEVSLAEKREDHVLKTIETLLSNYPKQLSIVGFQEISDEIKTHQAFLLADCGRWAEAKPLLEAARCPESWKGVLHYYRGHCHYQFKEYKLAKRRLVKALSLGMAPNWEEKTRYVLGLVEYYLGNLKAAKDQFILYLSIASPESVKDSKIWEWLEDVSRALGDHSEAEEYRKRREGRSSSRVN